ncbi:hypothetical protein GCM10023310_14010 [Paenibacillus vulneris]|uniref:Lipoprotein n=1 Tax=Paenibacillus vulneris TaxID=1133364 RepID=A0ABW3UHV1_9BACL|nr:hypothetical protein [Paenibacillus sp. OAS669]MBE1441615.1 hypothetical protein [Paenibacillus sp. OAS669]
MTRKRFALSTLSLLIAVTALTACNKNTANPNDPGTKPATLQGESEHWRVKVDYTAKGSKLEESVTVEYKIDEEISDAALAVIHADGTSLVNAITEPSLAKPGQPITLDKKGEVTTWTGTDQAQVEWKVGEQRTKEYITLKNKTSATP